MYSLWLLGEDLVGPLGPFWAPLALKSPCRPPVPAAGALQQPRPPRLGAAPRLPQTWAPGHSEVRWVSISGFLEGQTPQIQWKLLSTKHQPSGGQRIPYETSGDVARGSRGDVQSCVRGGLRPLLCRPGHAILQTFGTCEIFHDENTPPGSTLFAMSPTTVSLVPKP